jgi:hypothetical protein
MIPCRFLPRLDLINQPRLGHLGLISRGELSVFNLLRLNRIRGDVIFSSFLFAISFSRNLSFANMDLQQKMRTRSKREHPEVSRRETSISENHRLEKQIQINNVVSSFFYLQRPRLLKNQRPSRIVTLQTKTKVTPQTKTTTTTTTRAEDEEPAPQSEAILK